MRDRVIILNITHPPTYNPNLFVQPRRIIAKVNGVLCDYVSKISPTLQEDLENYGIYKSDVEVEIMFKDEACEWYHDNIKTIRKEKLQKIINKFS